MKIIIISFASVFLIATTSCADIFKCTDSSGKVSYLDKPCPSSSKSDQIDTGSPQTKKYSLESPHPDSGKKIDVSKDVIKKCYESYQKISLDPPQSEMLGYWAEITPSGAPVLTVDAIFRNKFGGPDRLSCYCKLTDDLQLDEESLKKSIFKYYLKVRGEERILKNVILEEMQEKH